METKLQREIDDKKSKESITKTRMYYCYYSYKTINSIKVFSFICLLLFISSSLFAQEWINPNPGKYENQKEWEDREYAVKEVNRKISQVRNLYSEQEMSEFFYLAFDMIYHDYIENIGSTSLASEMFYLRNINKLLDFMLDQHQLPQEKRDIFLFVNDPDINYDENIIKKYELSLKIEAVAYVICGDYSIEKQYRLNRNMSDIVDFRGSYRRIFDSFSEKDKIDYLKNIYLSSKKESPFYKQYEYTHHINSTQLIESNYLFLIEEVSSDTLLMLLEIIHPDVYNYLKKVDSESINDISGTAYLKASTSSYSGLGEVKFTKPKPDDIRLISSIEKKIINDLNNHRIQTGRYEVKYTIGSLNTSEPYINLQLKKLPKTFWDYIFD